jgi:EAL domain-containing protein (putative c-di-GMP-specific phosphodiesterase class I)
VLYQPIVDLDTGEIVAVEALARWAHPERGTIGPDVFIPIAERTGAIGRLGRWVLTEATAQAARWHRELGHRLYVSVNLSPLQLRPDLVAEVRATLDRAGLDPQDLVLELTESALVQESDSVAVLSALRDLGIRVAVDDFGTGYSSLRYLARLPVDVLKLDRCFVAELDGDPRGAAVAEAVIRLAHALALETVAEGIEEPEQAAELRRLGYRTGQGYHFARPMPADSVAALLRAGAPAGHPS